MLKLIYRMSQLKFSELMDVYAEGNRENGAELYPHLPMYAQIQEAEQDFYRYLNDIFFRQEGAFYAVWEESGSYRTALRMEPYQDGLLLCALETAPDDRRRGYAVNLIRAVLNHLELIGSVKVYSHVSKKNFPSIMAHKNCGFTVLLDHAVYSDGSVLHNSYTLVYETIKSET